VATDSTTTDTTTSTASSPDKTSQHNADDLDTATDNTEQDENPKKSTNSETPINQQIADELDVDARKGGTTVDVQNDDQDIPWGGEPEVIGPADGVDGVKDEAVPRKPKTGLQRGEYSGGTEYKNISGPKLPETTEDGAPIKYKEYDLDRTTACSETTGDSSSATMARITTPTTTM